LSVTAASAATFNFVGEFSGNGCTGGGNNPTFPENFVQGPIVAKEDGSVCLLEDSPSIVKYNVGGATEVNDVTFPDFDADWISITGDKSGTWSYNPDASMAVGITGAYFKGGTSYFVYLWTGETPYFGGDGAFFNWTTGDSGLSNAVFFDSNSMAPIPLPAAGWLLLAGVGGLVAMRRKKAA
jgi:hypothetical protein